MTQSWMNKFLKTPKFLQLFREKDFEKKGMTAKAWHKWHSRNKNIFDQIFHNDEN